MSRALDLRTVGGGGSGNDPRLPDAGNSGEYLKSVGGSWALDTLTVADVTDAGDLASLDTADLAQLSQAAKERTLAIGKAGTISATDPDAADFLLPIPANMTLLRMKVTCKTAPSGSMVVQLRNSTNSGSSWSDVANFTVTFSASSKIAVVDPANVNVSEGDILNFSVTTGSGANLLVEVVAMPR